MSGKFIILGDVHIGGQSSVGKTIPGFLNSRVLDQLNLLDWTLQQAVDNYCSDIIITGDIFEEPIPEITLIKHFMKWLNSCSHNNVKVHIIMGNHDFIKVENKIQSVLDIILESNIENVYVYKNIQTIFIDDCAVTLSPYKDRKFLGLNSNDEALTVLKDSILYEGESITKNYNKILIGHNAIKGSIYVGTEVDDLDNELFLEISDLNCYDFVWMGHIHSPQVMNKTSPFVAHIGSMDRTSFLESEINQEKHIILFDSSLEKKFIKINLPTRPLKKIVIEVPENIDNTTDYVLSKLDELNVKENILKLDFVINNVNAIPLNKNKIEKSLLNNGAHNVCNISESKKTLKIKTSKEINNSSKIDSINTKDNVFNAIDLYSEMFINDPLKDGFKKLAKEILSEVKYESA